MDVSEPVVSIICTAYNHESYIAQALDGFLSQQTTFPFEIIVSDDASTDKTADIICRYEREHPGLFRTFYHSENQYSRHIPFFVNELVASARGKYLALCEGDDYWTNPLKLQKQVDFLENNPAFSACFHDCAILLENDGSINHKASKANEYNNNVFTTKHLIIDGFVNTCTVILRTEFLIIPKFFYEHLIDRLLLQLISLKGPIIYLNEEMAVYRKHSCGITNKEYSSRDIEQIQNRWDKFNVYTNFKYGHLIKVIKRSNDYQYLVKEKDRSWIIKIKMIFNRLVVLYYRKDKNILKIIKSSFKHIFNLQNRFIKN
jgi:glycosyltransferase involved in cell wall biosynthesis